MLWIGNTLPTVTDANVVLQALNSDYLLDGQLKIASAASYHEVESLANHLGFDVMTTAQGVIRVVVAAIAWAICVISVRREHDPREFTLVAVGGARPWQLAQSDAISVVTPGAGGYGPPAGRDRDSVRAELREERISTAIARDIYG